MKILIRSLSDSYCVNRRILKTIDSLLLAFHTV